MEKQDMVYTMIARYNDAIDNLYKFGAKVGEVYPDFFDGVMAESWDTFCGAFIREAIDLCCIANELHDGYKYQTTDAWFVGPNKGDGSNEAILWLPEDTAEEREEPTQAD